METNTPQNTTETNTDHNDNNPINLNAVKTSNSTLLLIGKMFLVGFLALLLGLPLLIVQFVVKERVDRQDEVKREISQTWGGDQTIIGPVLVIPYKKYYRDNDDKIHYSISNTYFLPDKLTVEGDLKTQIKHRNVFKVPVYQSSIDLSGTFKRPDFSQWKISDEHILWDQGYLLIGVSEVHALQNKTYVFWNNEKLPFRPIQHESSQYFLRNSLKSDLKNLNPQSSSYSFQTKLQLSGSSKFKMVPVGEESSFSLQSNWPHPKFFGASLPTKHQIADSGSQQGFQAKWQASSLNRGFPTQWLEKEIYENHFEKGAFGVEMINPVDNYRLATRANKYSMLFVALTFLTFFLLEVFNRKVRVHPIQYLFVGFSLCIFYLLLLSLSEVIGFSWAYLSGAISIVFLISFYMSRVLQSFKRALLLGGILSGLYLYLYTLLQLEDYALLAGSLGLFLILASIMLITRRVDWYRLSLEKSTVTN
ncbi:MAG: cell envelope integrity protein CreD [Deltaproteobacteria bacterium]|nr:cell envelope integrity protein CreD [Deltaproteobacteria bacterium]